MATKNKVLIASVVSLVALALIAYVNAERQPRTAAAPSTDRPQAKPEAPRPSPTPRAVGLLGRYALSYDMTLSGPDGSIHFMVAGNLDVTPSSETSVDERTAVMSEIRGGGVAEAARTDLAANPEHSFGQAWRLRLASNGTLLDTSFATTMPQSARSVLAQVASVAQLSVAEANAVTWSSEESDPNSRYLARYERRGANEYKKTWTAKGLVAGEDDIVGGTGDATLVTAGGNVERVDAVVTQRFRLSNRNNRSITNSIRISLVRKPEQPSLASVAIAETEAMGAGFAPFDAAQMPRATEREKDEQAVAGRDFARIVADIERADSAGAWQVRKSVGFDLAAYLRLNPAAVENTVELIATTTKPAVQRTLIESLVNAGTPQGQRGLVKTMGDSRLSKEVINDARITSGAIKHPIDDLLVTLERDSLSDDPAVAYQGRLSYAAVLRNATEGGAPDVSKRLEAFIARGVDALAQYGLQAKELPPSLGATSGPKLRRPEALRWLAAIAETHAPKTLPLFVEAIRSKDRLMRAQAALQIGRVGGEAAKPLLIERVSADPDYVVRKHALSTIGDLGPAGTLETVKSALYADKEPAVRATAVYVVGSWLKTAPELRSVLDTALDKENEMVVVNTILDVTIPERGFKESTKKMPVRRGL